MSDDDVVLEPEDDGAEESTAHKVKKLREELKKAQHERDDYLAGWQRSKADYVNLSRRVREADEGTVRAQAAKLARGIIAVLDSLEAGKKKGGSAEVLAPIERQIEDVLKTDFMITRFTPHAGDAFDPLLHEPIQTVASSTKEDDNTISETLQSGYAIDGSTIRPARVVVRHYQHDS